MTNWIPTDRVRGGYEPADSAQSKEYSDLSLNNPTVVTPGSYANPIAAVTPPTTSIRPAPPQLDPIQLVPSPPPDIPTTGSWTQKSSTQTSSTKSGTSTITKTTTTTESSMKFNNGVVDVSIIPYMRRIDVDFHAVGMRPNRKVYFFFDDTDVTRYISPANEMRFLAETPPDISVDPPFLDDIEDDNGTLGDQIIANTSPGWTAGGNPGSDWRRSGFRGTKRMQVRNRKLSNGQIVLHTTGGHDPIPAGSVIRTTGKDKKFVVDHNEVKTGRLSQKQWFLDSANTANADLIRSVLILDDHFRHLPNNWWGTDGSNGVFFMNHQDHPKRTRNKMKIRGWDNSTGRLTIDSDPNETVPGFSVDPFVSSDDAMRFANDGGEDITDSIISMKPLDPSLNAFDPLPPSHYGIHKIDETGSIIGTFHIPAGTFFTGQKIFRIIDNEDNDTDSDATTTYAEYKFISQGLHTVVQDVVINSTMSKTTVKRTSGGGGEKPNKGKTIVYPEVGHSSHDPLAQSFWVDPSSYPQGMFVSSVDLFFGNKDPVQPVHIEIRPTVNGYPDSNYVVPGSKSTKPSQEVNVSDAPDVTNSSTATKFVFGDPVFLPPGEYAIVIHSKSPEYEVYVSQLGDKIIGSTNIVSEQPYIGSIFKSQNASTWDASQLEDLMFVINKCSFVSSGRATMYSSAAMQAAAPYGMYPTPVDELMLHTEQAALPGTGLSYELASDSGNVFSPALAGTVLIPDTGRIYYPSNADTHTNQEGFFKLAINMETENPDISPVIWNERFGAAMYENQIDDASPTPIDFNIISTGSGYPANSNLALVISGTGSGTEAYAVSNATGHIVDILLQEAGSGYTSNAVISITSGSGSGAEITLTSETDPSGGPAWCKYISRTVTLNEGFESADLKAFVTAYRPAGTGFYVYYKVRNHNDPESFAKKPWVQMVQKKYLVEYSRNGKDYLEFEFLPFGEDEPFKSISYTSGGATYNTFDQYAIKIVLTTSDTTIFPVLRNMRAIAMPAVEQL